MGFKPLVWGAGGISVKNGVNQEFSVSLSMDRRRCLGIIAAILNDISPTYGVQTSGVGGGGLGVSFAIIAFSTDHCKHWTKRMLELNPNVNDLSFFGYDASRVLLVNNKHLSFFHIFYFII